MKSWPLPLLLTRAGDAAARFKARCTAEAAFVNTPAGEFDACVKECQEDRNRQQSAAQTDRPPTAGPYARLADPVPP